MLEHCLLLIITKQQVEKSFRCIEQTYLLVWVPHNMFDILCVRVHNSNTLILVFFIDCEAGSHNIYVYNQTVSWCMCNNKEDVTQTFPDPDAFVSATRGKQIP